MIKENNKSVVCEYCNQEFEGVNEAQANAQLIQHKVFKHKDKLQLTRKS